MVWKNASEIFTGSTDEVKALLGKKVRPLRSVSYHRFRGEDKPFDSSIQMPMLSTGFVAYPYKDYVLVTFDSTSSARSLDQIMKGGTFNVMAVDYGNFKHNFQIEL